MHSAFIKNIFRFRWLVIASSILLFVFAANGLGRITIASDYKSFLNPNYEGLVQLNKVEAIFTENNRMMVAIAPPHETIFTAKTIAMLQDITEQAWLLPYATRVDSIVNYQHTRADGDDLYVGSFFPDDKPITQAMLEVARTVSTVEPAIKHNLVSLKQDVAVLQVTFDFPADSAMSIANDESVIAAYKLFESYEQAYPDTNFYLTGTPVIDHALGKYGKRDNVTLIPAMLALMALILFVMTRSISGVFAAGIIVIFTGVITLGLLGWTGWIIDPASSMASIVIMTLAVADSVHIIEGMQKSMRGGANKITAIADSFYENVSPVFLTSLTTVFGVITFTFTNLATLERIGVTVALGVTIAFILSVSLLPALLAVLPMKVKPRHEGDSIYLKLARFTTSRYRPIVIVAVVVVAILASLAPLNRFNDSPQALVASYTEERKAVDFFENYVTGVTQVDIAIFSGTAGGVNDPVFLKKIDEFDSWLKQDESVNHVATIADMFKRLNKNMHGDDPAWNRLPESQNLAAQYLLLYEMSLPYGLDLNNQIDIDKSGVRTTIIMSNGDSENIYRKQQEIYQWFSDNAPELTAIVSGVVPTMAEVSYRHMIPGMMNGGMIAIAMVSLVLLFALRRIKLGIMGMLANMVPLLMGYGIWYLINGQVNFVVASVAGICLGVVVDFAVHFLSKYQRERRAGCNTETAIERAYIKTGRPLWTTMVMLVSGFWLLMLSPVTLSFSMGALTGIVILLALVFDLLVLPALLMIFDRKKLPVDDASVSLR
jgi:hypothetical protein